ncbi:MAG: FAD:protein FMN transferase [Lachnospiraceae bacterium]|nr:FAD:protein FMN transferase [Lachnospiraceae bacterium]
MTDKREEASRTGLYFDTPVTIRIYDENAEALLDGCFEICDELQGVLSAYESSSELYRLNNRNSSAVEVSEALSECIKMGIEAGNMSGGEFDITIYPVSSLWDFRSGEGRVPDASDIKKALRHVDYTGVKAEGGVIELRDSGAKIDLGAVAKGYISGRIRSYLRENGCDGAVINLGGNVSTVGVKPDGGSFKVGVQKPFEDRGAVSAVVQMQEGCIISSGTYERYFVQNGITYHHILSAGTGYPADTGLVQVTVIGNDDMLCDTLSTVGILLGRERTETLLDEKGYDVGLIFTEDDGRMTLYKPGSGEREISEGEVIDLTDKTREFEQ